MQIKFLTLVRQAEACNRPVKKKEENLIYRCSVTPFSYFIAFPINFPKIILELITI